MFRLWPGVQVQDFLVESCLLPAFGQMHLVGIDKPGVARWFDGYSKIWPGGANRLLEILLSILEFAIVCGYLKENPVQGIAKNPKRVLNRFLSAEEITRLSKVLKKPARKARTINRARILPACCC